MAAYTRWLLLMVSACAPGRAYFRPAEQDKGVSWQGHPEAVYDLTGREGRAGEVKVYSRGAYRNDGQTVVHVGFEVENPSAGPVTIDLDQLQLEVVWTRHGTIEGLAPTWTAGNPTVASDRLGALDVLFVLDGVKKPKDVTGFNVSWAAVFGKGDVLRQFTPFVRGTYPNVYYLAPWPSPFWPHYYYYDHPGLSCQPFCHPYRHPVRHRPAGPRHRRK